MLRSRLLSATFTQEEELVHQGAASREWRAGGRKRNKVARRDTRRKASQYPPRRLAIPGNSDGLQTPSISFLASMAVGMLPPSMPPRPTITYCSGTAQCLPFAPHTSSPSVLGHAIHTSRLSYATHWRYFFLARRTLSTLSRAATRFPAFTSHSSPLSLTSAGRHVSHSHMVFPRALSSALSISSSPLPASVSCVVVFPIPSLLSVLHAL